MNRISHGDMTVDAVITAPPSLSQPRDPRAMVRSWLHRCDRAWTAGPELWRECYRVMKPGAHLVCVADTTAADLLSMAIRLGGFEIRDAVGYARAGGEGIAWTPVIVARRPPHGTVTENVLAYGTGALHIDAVRVGTSRPPTQARSFTAWRRAEGRTDLQKPDNDTDTDKGRWPANLVHDGSAPVLDRFDSFGERAGGQFPAKAGSLGLNGIYGRSKGLVQEPRDMDSGSISRFFFSAPDRETLLAWFHRMVCPPGGIVVDPFKGQSAPIGGWS